MKTFFLTPSFEPKVRLVIPHQFTIGSLSKQTDQRIVDILHDMCPNAKISWVTSASQPFEQFEVSGYSTTVIFDESTKSWIITISEPTGLYWYE